MFSFCSWHDSIWLKVWNASGIVSKWKCERESSAILGEFVDNNFSNGTFSATPKTGSSSLNPFITWFQNRNNHKILFPTTRTKSIEARTSTYTFHLFATAIVNCSLSPRRRISISITKLKIPLFNGPLFGAVFFTAVYYSHHCPLC